MRLGFALLTHTRPEQILSLARTLRRMFPDAAIACHHDFGQEPGLVREAFPNVQFVADWRPTGWGTVSVIEGALAALRLARDTRPAPDWYYLLSAADIPCRPARSMLRDLAAAQADVFIGHSPVPDGRPSDNLQEVRQFRYFAFEPPAFPSGFACHAGDQWFTANRRAIDVLLDHAAQAPALLEHYRRLEADRHVAAEESFYHTLFLNCPGLRIENNNLRHIVWDFGAHPKTLTLRDLPGILGSGAHFARKVEPRKSVGLLATLALTRGLRARPAK